MKSQVWSQSPDAAPGLWRDPAETRRDGRSRGAGRGARPGRQESETSGGGKAKPKPSWGGRGEASAGSAPTSQSRPDSPGRTLPVAAPRRSPHTYLGAGSPGRAVRLPGWPGSSVFMVARRGRAGGGSGGGRGGGGCRCSRGSHVLRTTVPQAPRASSWVRGGRRGGAAGGAGPAGSSHSSPSRRLPHMPPAGGPWRLAEGLGGGAGEPRTKPGASFLKEKWAKGDSVGHVAAVRLGVLMGTVQTRALECP